LAENNSLDANFIDWKDFRRQQRSRRDDSNTYGT
jgi:hypothetical protein